MFHFFISLLFSAFPFLRLWEPQSHTTPWTRHWDSHPALLRPHAWMAWQSADQPYHVELCTQHCPAGFPARHEKKQNCCPQLVQSNMTDLSRTRSILIPAIAESVLNILITLLKNTTLPLFKIKPRTVPYRNQSTPQKARVNGILVENARSSYWRHFPKFSQPCPFQLESLHICLIVFRGHGAYYSTTKLVGPCEPSLDLQKSTSFRTIMLELCLWTPYILFFCMEKAHMLFWHRKWYIACLRSFLLIINWSLHV